MANEHIVVLRASGGIPEIEFIIGNAQWGSYRLSLHRPGPAGGQEIGQGVNWDNVSDRFAIGLPAQELHACLLSWTIAITPVTVGDPYVARVNVYQGNQVVDGGTILHQGTTLLQTHPVAGLVKVVAI